MRSRTSNSHHRVQAATTNEPARKKRPHPESHMMTMLRAPTATKQGAERSRSDGLDGVERFFLTF
jgi:hypothetical protein